MRNVVLIAAIGILISGCSDKIPTMPEGERTFTISGQVLNQFSTPASELKIIVSDTYGVVDSIVTDSTGAFSFPGFHRGSAGIRFVPTTTVVTHLPRYLYAETAIDLQGDTVVNFYVREFNEIFHDDGTQQNEWITYGGVSHSDSSYIFTDRPGLSDSMIMTAPVQLPTIAGPILFLIQGAAVPSDSGLIRVRVVCNGEYVGMPHDLVFSTDTTFREIYAAELAGQPGSMVQLDLTMQTTLGAVHYPASEIHLTDIWIFSY